jgi:DNA-binding NtrC family response regulator
MTARLLIVDDEPAICASMSMYLTRVGFTTSQALSLEAARAQLASQRIHGILLDLALPDGSGLQFISEVRASFPDIAIVVITGSRDTRTAVDAMQRGADHFIEKPVDMTELEIFLKKSIEVGALRRRTAVQQRLDRNRAPFFGESAAAREAQNLGRLAALTDASILLTGETGTGKGVLARWIHSQSDRRGTPFVEVNCSSLRGEMLANELFGHARGAFTSAVDSRAGLLDAADGGTLFLDEIGDMDPSIQPQFLKVVEEKRYRRLGEVQVRSSDFRLICATNRNLKDEVAKRAFRIDLFHRINIVPIALPPLRRMHSDVPSLVAYLLSGLTYAAGIHPEALTAIREYDWPGNVRELRNVLERATILARGDVVRLEHLRGLDRPSAARAGAESDDILVALERVGGDKHSAARNLGISRATLYRRLQRLRQE